MRKFFARKKIKIILVILVVIALALVSRPKKNNGGVGEIHTIQKGNISKEVNVTGRVKPTEDVKLAFERGGKIAGIYAKVGAEAKAGQFLMQLVNDDLYAQQNQAFAAVKVQAQLRQYKAALDSQKAKFAELKRGTRAEEIKIAQTSVDNAKKAFEDAKTNLKNVEDKASSDISNIYDDVADVLNDAYAKADDAVRVKSAGIVAGDTTNGYRVLFSTCDAKEAGAVANLRSNLENSLSVWKSKLNEIKAATSRDDLDKAIIMAKTNLDEVEKFVERANGIVTASCLASDSARATDRTNIGTARTNIITAQTSLNTQSQAILTQKVTNYNLISSARAKSSDAQNALDSAQDQLDLKKAGTAPEQLAYQEALVAQATATVEAQEGQVLSAQAGVQNAQAQIEKTILRAPFSGIITKVDWNQGEIISAGAVAVSVISTANFEIDANIPEVDIASIALGNPVNVVLDAVQNETLAGKVVAIDPAETVVDGVVNFKVTIVIDKTDGRLKSGLTANLAIITEQKNDILVIPEYAIIENDAGLFARKIENGNTIDVPIQTGIRSQDGLVEIISGLVEGDIVVNVGIKK